MAPALAARIERRGQARDHADGDVVGVRRAEARACACGVGVVGVAVGGEARAFARRAVGGAEAKRAAQEGERGDDVGRPARRGLAEQQHVVAVARGAQAGLAGQEQAAVERGGRRAAVGELRAQELGMVGLVPDRPDADAVAVAPADGGREGLELVRVRLGHVVAVVACGPARHRAGERDLHRDLALRRGGEQAVEAVPGPGRVGRRVGRVELRLGARAGWARSPSSRRAPARDRHRTR